MILRCELCRKDFKTDAQLQQHFASKNHKKKQAECDKKMNHQPVQRNNKKTQHIQDDVNEDGNDSPYMNDDESEAIEASIIEAINDMELKSVVDEIEEEVEIKSIGISRPEDRSRDSDDDNDPKEKGIKISTMSSFGCLDSEDEEENNEDDASADYSEGLKPMSNSQHTLNQDHSNESHSSIDKGEMIGMKSSLFLLLWTVLINMLMCVISLFLVRIESKAKKRPTKRGNQNKKKGKK
jgi:hypothetical protein